MPMEGVKTHQLYDPDQEMYVIVGQSMALTSIMNERLNAEISRGLVIFFLALIGGCLLIFVFISWFFERRLQISLTKPIMQLSRQIKNPKEFMKERNKSSDVYTRKNTILGRNGTKSRRTSQESTLETQEGSRSSINSLESPKNRDLSMALGASIANLRLN